MAMDFNNMTMNFKWFFKKDQMAIAMVYSVHNTTMMRVSFQKA
jgi:hypothetical protein